VQEKLHLESTYLAADHSYTLASKAVPPPPHHLAYSGTVRTVFCANPVCKSADTRHLTQYDSFKESVPVKCESCGQFTCCICKRPFGKQAGLSIHLRGAHSELYHAAVPTVRKQRWNYETLSESRQMGERTRRGTQHQPKNTK